MRSPWFSDIVRPMRKLAITIVALVLMLSVTSAYAAEVVSGTTLPPAVYDHEPSMPIEEHVLSFEQVTAFCQHHWGIDPSHTYLGCANRVAGTCIIYRVADDRVRRHERAHCAGWPASHTIAVPSPPPASPAGWHREVVETKPWPANAPDVVPLVGEASPRRDLISDAIRRTPWTSH